MKKMKTGGPLFRLTNKDVVPTIEYVNPSLLDLIYDPPFVVTKAERDLILALIWPLKKYLGVRVPPIGGVPGEQSDVDALYKERAADYLELHSLTTDGADDQWRRWAAEIIVAQSGMINHLDLFTGVGSTAREMLTACQKCNRVGRIVALDHSPEMLKFAEAITERMFGRTAFVLNEIQRQWMRGDATKLNFSGQSFQSISAVCGIGAIDYPRVLQVYEEALRVLKPGGIFIVTEMHRPRRSEPGVWPMFGQGGEFLQAAESLVWESYTLPFALGELWGWVDPTPGEEVGPFTTITDSDGKHWGWRIEYQRFEAMPWRGIPVMPYYWGILRKVPIKQRHVNLRSAVIDSLDLITA
jgi:ubiquinone/menaquinone biosynthesis C-methylase UbiE